MTWIKIRIIALWYSLKIRFYARRNWIKFLSDSHPPPDPRRPPAAANQNFFPTPAVHIYAPSVWIRKVKKQKCPTCKGLRRFICDFYEWHGWYQTCLTCGDTWAEGERLERPFRRGWRQEAVKEAKERAKNCYDRSDELMAIIERERR